MKYNINTIEGNEKCPCGSELKFDKCCKISITNATSSNIGQFKNDKHITDFIRKKYKESNISLCLHPNHEKCNGEIIKAHTLQNNKILSKLAVDKHVLVISHESKIVKTRKMFRFTKEYIDERLNSQGSYAEQLNEMLNKLDKNEIEKYYGKIIEAEVEQAVLKYNVDRKGKNEATVFTGFCKYHDSSVFSPIEDYDYNEEIRQDFLFAYRAFASEYHDKLRTIKSYRSNFKSNPNLYKDIGFILDYRYMQIDEEYMNELKIKFDEAIINEKYDILETVTIKLPKAYDFAVTGMIALEIDLEGKMLNDKYSLESDKCKSLYLTVFPTESETIVLISWLKEDSMYFKNYKEQIKDLDKYKLKCYLNNIIPAYTPNVVLSPRLWNKQISGGQKEFLEAFEKVNECIEYTQTSPIKLSEKRKKTLKSFDKFLKNTKYSLFK